MRTAIVFFILIGFFLTNCAAAQSAAACPRPSGVSLQVLGSGGPVADDGRASASYIVWVDGKSRVMIDVGGGAFLRFGEAAASFDDLSIIGLSHFHTDHSADFPALLKSGYFSYRERSLRVAGPSAGGPFPGLDSYLRALLAPGTGAFGYLSGYLDGSGGLVRLEPREINISRRDASTVFESSKDAIRVEAMGVPHGIVPALAFKVTVGEIGLVFASDQNGKETRFIDFATGADVLVMHMPIPEGATGGATQLHAPPSVIGTIARSADVEMLLLSHFMARSLRNIDRNVTAVKAGYDGRILLANDLDCLNID